MCIVVKNGYTDIPIMEAKIGKVYIITDTHTDKLDHYRNNIVIRTDPSTYNNNEGNINLVIIGPPITQIIINKRDCDKSEYKLFKITEVIIERIEVKVLHS